MGRRHGTFERALPALLCAAIAGCGGRDDRDAPRAATPVPTASPSPTPDATPEPTPVRSPRVRVRAAVALSPPDSSDIWDLQDSGRYRPHDVLSVADTRARGHRRARPGSRPRSCAAERRRQRRWRRRQVL